MLQYGGDCANLNTLTKSGWYYVYESTSGLPSGFNSQYGVVVVFKANHIACQYFINNEAVFARRTDWYTEDFTNRNWIRLG